MTGNHDTQQHFNFFKRLNIRPKLIGIISIIIIVSLSGMIFLATRFFKTESRTRIEENNHKLAEVTSQKIQTDISSVVDKLNLMGTTMLQEFKTKTQKDLFTTLFFKNEKNFIYVAIARKNSEKEGLLFQQSIYNEDYFREVQLTLSDIQKINRQYSEYFSKSFNNEALIKNVSRSFKAPVIALTFPFQRSSSNKVISILTAYIKLDILLQAFRKQGITESFLLNHEGDVLAHPDPQIVLSHGNFIHLPIVQMMLKSNIDNGQTRYQADDGKYYIGAFKKIDFSNIAVFVIVEEDLAFQEVYRIQRYNLYIMGIVVVLAFLIVYFFGKTLTTPILHLVEATKQIEQGDFFVTIKPTTGDEIGTLTRSFIAMGKGLEERDKMKDALGKFVNKEIAEQVLRGNIQLGGERKKVTVFFSDIRSFTAISEKLEPEEVVEFLNQYMTRMVECVNITHGVVDKFIGDAIMAIWGAPISTETDTINSINGALMMRNELMGFNRGRGGDKKPIIRIGCGINTGPVLAGQIGSEEKMEYTVIGDTVNLASRIEALNKPFGTDILISQDTYEEVREVFMVEPMQKIKVKGKTEPQQIYAVLGRLDDPSAPKTLEELRELVGIEMKEKKDVNVDEEEVKYEILE